MILVPRSSALGKKGPAKKGGGARAAVPDGDLHRQPAVCGPAGIVRYLQTPPPVTLRNARGAGTPHYISTWGV